MKKIPWILFCSAGCLLGLSIWALSLDVSMQVPWFTYVMNRRSFLPWHAIQIFITFVLAYGVGRWLSPKQILRFWWAPVAFLFIIAATLPFWFTGDIASLFSRSPGWVFAIFTVLAGLRYALPDLLHREEPSAPSRPARRQAGILVYVLVLLFAALFSAFGSRHTFSLSLVLFGMIGMATWVVLRGWWRWAGIFMTVGILAGLWIVTGHTRSDMVAGLMRGDPRFTFQVCQSLMAIHAGGVTGFIAQPVFVPESTTDFMYARICMGGGLVAATALLIVTGFLLTTAWRLVTRQRDPRLRTVAASIAALWSVCSLAHIAINVAWWPTMGIAFPFLSIGRVFLFMHAILLGLLMSIARDRSAVTESDGEALPPRWPVSVIQVGIVLALALFAIRSGWLVFDDHAIRERRQAEMARIEARLQEQNKPVRGHILDAQGRVLAQHGERHYVCVDPQVLANSTDRSLYPEMLRLIGLDSEAFTRRTADTTRRYVRLATVPTTTAEAVRRMNLQAIFIDSQPARDYPLEIPLTHIAGFVTAEMAGGSGVEQSRHGTLAAGGDVRLTIDADLQAAVQSVAEDIPAAQVQIVIMNPRTGAIRAAAQKPATHATHSPTADPRARTWRSNSDVFEPGGLIAPLVLASAFDMGVIDADKPINTENGLWMHHGVSLRDPHPRAEMTPADVLINAGNIGMAKTGLAMGTNALYEALVNWGLNAPAVVCIPGSMAGLLHRPERWSQITITRLPIGHELACTLMQLLRAYTVFWNDGYMVEPYIIEDCKSASASRAQAAPISSASAKQVRGLLERVVADGTARQARMDGITVFGKTAVIPKAIAGGYASDKFHKAFIGGFEPEGCEPVLIAVWLDEPDEAAPSPATIFRNIADKKAFFGLEVELK